MTCLLAHLSLSSQTKNNRETDDTWINRLLSEHHVPCVAWGEIKEGKLQQIKVYGQVKSGKLAAPYNTLFNVASLTKPVFAMLVLKLVSSGNWSLDEPLAKYWVDPDIANDSLSKKLTTRHILSHQSGFSNWRWEAKDKKLRFYRHPGSGFGYSGEGFEYLKKAIEIKFDKKLENLMDSIIFKPLKMNDSYMVYDSKIDISRFAHWHDSLGVESYRTRIIKVALAADDMITTIEDYSKFVVACMDGFGLSKELHREMLRPQARMNDHTNMGLGWAISQKSQEREPMIKHEGSDIGVNTIVQWRPNSKDAVIIFTNGDNGWRLFGDLIGATLREAEEK